MSSIAHIIHRRKRRRTNRRARVANSQSLLWGMAGTAALGILIPAVFLFGDAINAYVRANQMLPDPRQTIAVAPLIGASEIYDSSGTTLLVSVVDPFDDERTWITLTELSDAVVRGTLMMEDPDYLTTSRLNLFQSIGELLNNNLKGPLPADPSLTGRLVRNAIATPPEFVTVDDRALEIALAAEVNRLYTPEEVLEWHLNTNYYGNQAYGIETAAQIYLGKSARDLTLDEAALLVSIPTAPQYNPVDDLEATRSRQKDVLQRLLGGGVITQNAYEAASNTVTIIRPDAGQSPLVAPDFARYARRQAESILTALGRDGAGLVSRGGLRITTTLDLDLYHQTECLLRYRLEQLSGRDPSIVRSLDDQACISAQFLPPVQLALPN
ncbi:MAG: penicillin-binding protein, partial [Chitinophagaceae bacterium]|nr:penicillin-binding protein [Anaerolineae bacterium]